MLVFSKMPAAVSVEQNIAGLGLARSHLLRTVYATSVLDDPSARRGIRRFIEAAELAASLKITFEHVWRNAVSLTTACRRRSR